MQTKEKHLVQGQQLELVFASAAALDPVGGRRVTQDRAAWWFDRIHSRLRRALRPPPPARHEQAPLALPSAGSARWFLDAPRWGVEERTESQALEHAA